MIRWITEQDPLVIIAIGFVAGGLAQGLIDLLGREVSAYFEERRRLRRERREARLAAIQATLRHIITYSDYLMRRSGEDGDDATYDASDHTKARLALIGDADKLKRFNAIVAAFYRRIPGDPVPPEDVIELAAAREAVENALATQEDKVLSGKKAVEIPPDQVEAITAIEPMIRDQVARALRDQAERRGSPKP